jgi:hypothetical protein
MQRPDVRFSRCSYLDVNVFEPFHEVKGGLTWLKLIIFLLVYILSRFYFEFQIGTKSREEKWSFTAACQ